jgi:hypothetical protein
VSGEDAKGVVAEVEDLTEKEIIPQEKNIGNLNEVKFKMYLI